MRGSAVLIKTNVGYQKGYVGGIYHGDILEVFQSGETASKTKERTELILDEKLNAHDLAIGTEVIGEDVNSPGLIRQGTLQQIGDSFCTIKTNDETWKSNLNDVRGIKSSDFCSS